MSYTQIDPLLAYEHTHASSSKYGAQKKLSLLSSLRRTSVFLLQYCALSSAIFFTLMGALNYSAYSTRIMNWIDPGALIEARDEVNGLLTKATSLSVNASEAESLEIKEDINAVTEKLIKTNPEIVYARSYGPAGLLAYSRNDEESTSFELAPYENRIIIPRIGKNIPLVDVMIDHGASFETMHEVFMEELRKGVVRYPGTAIPGQKGNVFIFGHSSNFPWVKSEYNDVFALLDKLEKGDEIIIYYFQKKYVYRVTEHIEVKPGDVKTLNSRDPEKKELSLMTCWPVGTTLDRLITFAELVETSER